MLLMNIWSKDVLCLNTLTGVPETVKIKIDGVLYVLIYLRCQRSMLTQPDFSTALIRQLMACKVSLFELGLIITTPHCRLLSEMSCFFEVTIFVSPELSFHFLSKLGGSIVASVILSGFLHSHNRQKFIYFLKQTNKQTNLKSVVLDNNFYSYMEILTRFSYIPHSRSQQWKRVVPYHIISHTYSNLIPQGYEALIETE